MSEPRRFKSILDIPVRVEMSQVEHDSRNALTVDELAVQIEEAKKGKARVDSKYVNYQERGHLFEYQIDYPKFLDNMTHIIKEAQSRPKDDRYKNSHQMIIQ
jgi:hypothetical protein